ncbi:right-handed parallel beta-helix repeat-containing protein [Prosthecobacter sp. SYSU 5D2]|uniref:right-handed parallel beta-helix repeat-containing protein n=1 Tax=Prosthecobacter sp. SYSU 5D2 TaxID=3134134 RepID=UPI0031FE874F
MRFAPLLCFLFTTAVTAADNDPVTVDATKYPTLQAAFDAVPVTGGLVILPPGKFEITEPLRIQTEDTRVVGAGAATCIVNKNEDGQPALILRPPNLDKDKKAKLWRVQLADFRIQGQEKSGDGIFAHGIQEIYLNGMSVDHNGAHGIHLLDCYEDPRITGCILTYNKKCGIEIINCHDIVVNANHFEENEDALHCTDSFNLCMNGNNIDDHLRHGVIIENTYGSVVSGNMIEECNGTAVILDRDCYGITLSANVIAHHLEGGIDLRDAHGCAVSANTFTIAHKFSVRVSKDSGRITLSANNFCNTYIGSGQDKRPAEGKTPMSIDEGTGILLEGASHCTISANTFSGLSTAAIWSTSACKGMLISQNLAADCGRKLAAGSAWFAVESDTPGFITNNLEAR